MSIFLAENLIENTVKTNRFKRQYKKIMLFFIISRCKTKKKLTNWQLLLFLIF